MAKNFPGPSYNRLIDNDPQIVKVPMDNFQWGTRPSILARMSADARGGNPAKPSAPEMTIRHVKGE